MGEKFHTKRFWAEIIERAPLRVRRRASYYLNNVKKLSDEEWLVWSSRGARYTVKVEGDEITCSCPYFQEGKGLCKHVCAVAANELTELDFQRWRRRLGG